MNAVCPACGVAVVPGYVKCPKCHAKLPSYVAARSRGAEGGTAVPEREFPVVAVVVPLVLVAGIAVYFGLTRATAGGDPPAAPAVAATPGPSTAVPTAPVTTPPSAPADVVASAPSLTAVTNDLQRDLQRQRLWSTIETVGSRVDVRSTACSETAMGPALDGARELLRRAGATQLRCLSPSGSVVFARDL